MNTPSRTPEQIAYERKAKANTLQSLQRKKPSKTNAFIFEPSKNVVLPTPKGLITFR